MKISNPRSTKPVNQILKRRVNFDRSKALSADIRHQSTVVADILSFPLQSGQSYLSCPYQNACFIRSSVRGCSELTAILQLRSHMTNCSGKHFPSSNISQTLSELVLPDFSGIQVEFFRPKFKAKRRRCTLSGNV